MLLFLAIILGIIAFLVGASVFSFLNVVAYRLPKGLDYVRGRSMCPACAHGLNALDTLPVLGFLIRRGKCAYCGARISPRYMITEILGGALSLFCAWYYVPYILQWLVSFAFIAALYVVAVVDHDTMEIPNGFVIAIFVIAGLAHFIFPSVGIVSRVIGMFAASLPLFLITLVVKNAFGGGDIKLMAAAGVFLGWKLVLVGLAFAVLTGGIYGIWLLATKRVKAGAHFAFGPFLCVGCALSMFAGKAVLDWYIGFFA